MILIVCKSCTTAIRISGGEDGEMESLFGNPTKTYPCPSCEGDAETMDSVEAAAFQALDLYDLTPHEAFAAFNGLGLPKERDCGPAAVTNLFMNQKVVGVGGELIKGTNRTVLKHLEFADGTKMYFASSPYGATIYRIQTQRSFTDEVLSEHS